MLWPDIRKACPDQWLVIEALQAHTTANNQRILDHIAIIDICSDGDTVVQRYRQLHQQDPSREFYFVHTAREELNIRERQWLGIRKG